MGHCGGLDPENLVLCEDFRAAMGFWLRPEVALWYLHDLDPWGHSIRKLVDDLAVAHPATHERVGHLATVGIAELTG